MEVSTCVKMWYVYNELMLRGTKHGTLTMVKSNNTATPQSVKTSGKTVLANPQSGAIFTPPENWFVTGEHIAKFVKEKAAGSLAAVTVRPTQYFLDLGITPQNWAGHSSGMFATKTTTRSHELRCCLFGVVEKTIVTNPKSKAFNQMLLCKVGTKDASFKLSVIDKAVGAVGGKTQSGELTDNTLAMLLSGTNSTKRPHNFWKHPLVELVVTPNIKLK